MSVTAFKQIADNAISTTATSLATTGVTSIVLATGTGTLFPAPGNGFILTLWTGTDPTLDANMEKVTCTARSGDTLTISATAKTHTGTVNAALLDVAQNTSDLQTAINNIESGTNVIPGGGGGSSSLTAPVTVTGSNAQAVAVGITGATNPVFTVDTSTASTVTGLSVKGSLAGSLGAVIGVTGGNTNESITLRAKGSGSVQIYPNADAANIFSILNSTNNKVYMSVDSLLGYVQFRHGGVVSVANTTNANAFVVTQNGALTTSPAFNVDTSTVSSATGWGVKSQAAAAGALLTVLSFGANEDGIINGKGTGGIKLQTVATGQITFGSGLVHSSTTVTTTGTLTTAFSIVRVNSAGATTQTLPTTPATGTEILVKNVGAGVVTVGGTIDGATNYSLSAQYKFVRLAYNGTSWDITGSN